MTIALTCGEPSGVGPEIAAKAWHTLRGEIPLVWLGDPAHLPSGTPTREIDREALVAGVDGTDALPVLSQTMAEARPGTPNPANAQGVIDAIETGVSLCRDGLCSAVCTAPIHKKALADGAGFAYPGHTEFLAALGGVEDVVMMLSSPQLRVVPATIHIALSEVPRAFTPALLSRTIEITERALRQDFGIAQPRIAVAGLNPHAGEGGKMGQEEQAWMEGVIARFQAKGLEVSGPWPADTMFHAAARARYDVAICAYHDQALIPIKTLDFDSGVNVTLGLPFVRTSPDHGTAFDIAGKGIANPSSMIAAIRMAHSLAQTRKKAT